MTRTIPFINSYGMEYEIRLGASDRIEILRNDEAMDLEEYYRFAVAERERLYFELLNQEIRDTLNEADEKPDQNFKIAITPEDIASVLELYAPHTFTIRGHAAVRKTVKSGSSTTGRVYVPNAWGGREVMVILLDPPEEEP